MISFTATVSYLDRDRAITWADGVLSGDETALLMLEFEEQRYKNISIGPVEGPKVSTKQLQDPMGTLYLIQSAFHFVVSVTGDIPQRENEPGWN